MDYKYVIIGAGNGGQSLAGDMTLRGTRDFGLEGQEKGKKYKRDE